MADFPHKKQTAGFTLHPP